jgi:uncharacterized membrane protein YphA (DoxX/SURF4 family)
MRSKEVRYVVVRILVGLIILIQGSINISYLGRFEERATDVLAKFEVFSSKWLMEAVCALPFIEVLAGLLLVAGFLTKIVLRLSYLLYMVVSLIFIIINDPDSAFFYAFLSTVVFFLLIKIKYNYYWCLDKDFS